MEDAPEDTRSRRDGYVTENVIIATTPSAVGTVSVFYTAAITIPYMYFLHINCNISVCCVYLPFHWMRTG